VHLLRGRHLDAEADLQLVRVVEALEAELLVGPDPDLREARTQLLLFRNGGAELHPLAE
jgi:hypothetical protein